MRQKEVQALIRYNCKAIRDAVEWLDYEDTDKGIEAKFDEINLCVESLMGHLRTLEGSWVIPQETGIMASIPEAKPE